MKTSRIKLLLSFTLTFWFGGIVIAKTDDRSRDTVVLEEAFEQDSCTSDTLNKELTPVLIPSEQLECPTNLETEAPAVSEKPASEATVAQESTWEKLKRYRRYLFFTCVCFHGIKGNVPSLAKKYLESLGYKESNAQDHLINPMLEKAGLNPVAITVMEKAGGPPTGTPALAASNCIIAHYSTRGMTKEQHGLFQGVMGHEIMHLKNNDILVKSVVGAVGVFAIPYLLKKYAAGTQQFMEHLKNNYAPDKESALNKTLTSIEKVNTYVATSMVTEMCLWWYLLAKLSQFQEKRADIQAAQLYPQFTQGLISSFKKAKDNHIHIKELAQKFPYLLNEQQRRMVPFITKSGDVALDIAHPSLTERIKYLSAIITEQAKAA